MFRDGETISAWYNSSMKSAERTPYDHFLGSVRKLFSQLRYNGSEMPDGFRESVSDHTAFALWLADISLAEHPTLERIAGRLHVLDCILYHDVGEINGDTSIAEQLANHIDQKKRREHERSMVYQIIERLPSNRSQERVLTGYLRYENAPHTKDLAGLYGHFFDTVAGAYPVQVNSERTSTNYQSQLYVLTQKLQPFTSMITEQLLQLPDPEERAVAVDEHLGLYASFLGLFSTLHGE